MAAASRVVFPTNAEKRSSTGELEYLLEQVETEIETRERKLRRARREVLGDEMDVD